VNENDGLACTKCGCKHLPVWATRKTAFNRIKRVRICRACGHRNTTYEKVEEKNRPDMDGGA